MSEFLIPLDELFLLLNGLSLTGTDLFKVKSIIFPKDLFWVSGFQHQKQVSQLSKLLSKEQYVQALKTIRSETNEIPSYSDYRDMLFTAGVVKPEDWPQLSSTIINILDRNPLRGDKPIFISFDSNALIHRRYSFIAALIDKANSSRMSNRLQAGYVASRGVLSELERFDNKYTDNDIISLKDAFNSKDQAFDEFFNQLKLRERIFRIGFVEYRKMSEREYFYEEEGETGDIEIIKSLESFSKPPKASSRDLLIISGDSGFIDRAQARRLKGLRLDRPQTLPSKIQISWEEIAQLLYTSAIYFGAIRILGKTSARIYGIWKGKKAEHWNSETLKITTDSQKLQEFLKTSKEILSLK